MNIKYYNSKEAEKRYNERLTGEAGFSIIKLKDNDYLELRKEIVDAYNVVVKGNEKGYMLDIKFGLDLHEILNKKEWFSELLSSNYSFWKYISLEVIPDIIYQRHGIQKDYFYNKNVRIYASTIFWYINIFYRNSKIETVDFLSKKCFTTDTIMQIIERPGRKGMDVAVFKEILEQFSQIDESIAKDKGVSFIQLLRRVLVQHTAKSVVLVPDFCIGGIVGYVKMLFRIVLEGK